MRLPITAQYVFNLRPSEDSLKSQLWNFISLQKQHKLQGIFLASKANVITVFIKTSWKTLLQNWYLFGRRALSKLLFLCSNAGPPSYLKNSIFATFEGILNKFILQWFFKRKLLFSVLIWAKMLHIELLRAVIVALKSSH